MRIILFFLVFIPGFFAQSQDHIRVRVDQLNLEDISGNGTDNLNLLNTNQSVINRSFQLQLGYWKELNPVKNNYFTGRVGMRMLTIERTVDLSQITGSISQTGADQVFQQSYLVGVGVGKLFSVEQVLITLSTDFTFQRYNAIQYESEVEAIDTVTNSVSRVSVTEEQPAVNAFHLNTELQIGYVFWQRLQVGAGINTGLLLSLQQGEVFAQYRIDNGAVIQNPTISEEISIVDFQRKNPTAFFTVGFFF